MALYLTHEDLKDNTELQQHVDPHLLEPSIRYAQETYIEPLLGRDLAAQLTAQVNTVPTDPPTPPTPTELLNLALLERIKVALAWWSLFETIPRLAFKFTSQGVEIKSGKNGTPASRNDIEYIRNDVRKRAEDYTQRLKDYLLEHKADYPLYPTVTRGCEGSGSSRLVGGVYIPDGFDRYYQEREAYLYRKLIR